MKTIETQACKWSLTRNIGFEYSNMTKSSLIWCNDSVLLHKTSFPSVCINIHRKIYYFVEPQVGMS